MIEVLNQMADHDDIPSSRRPAVNLVPGERRGRKPYVQQNAEESPVAVSQVQLQEGGTPDFASLVEMPTPTTSPADTDSGLSRRAMGSRLPQTISRLQLK